jgi:hypothetical protein
MFLPQPAPGHPVVVDAEPCSGAAETDEHLVGDENDVMAGAQLPDLSQITSRRHDDAGAACHRFHHQRGDGRRAFEKDHLGELRERSLILFLGCARPERRAVLEWAEKWTAPAARV